MVVKEKPCTMAEFEDIFRQVSNWGRFGAASARGTLAYITPDRVRASARLVRSGRTVSLSLPLSVTAGPDNPRPARHYMVQTHDVPAAPGGPEFATDFIATEFHGDCFTHVDALCHISWKGKMFDGVPAAAVTCRGADRLDITAFSDGIVGRGVLLDIPRLRGVKWLEPGMAVHRAELEAAEKAQGVSLGEGDILLFRTGHHRRRLELGPWNNGYDGEGGRGCTSTPSLSCTSAGSRFFFPMAMARPSPAPRRGSPIQSTRCRSRPWE